MLKEIFKEIWQSLKRHKLRSFLTMLGIVWGIVSVTLLIAYGSSFRSVLMYTFEVFGKGAVVAWPGQTSEQAGGERAGRRIRFEKEDLEAVQQEATLIRVACRESVRFLGISYNDRLANTAIRGVCPEYGEMRTEIPSQGRWLSPEDEVERRRVVFLGARLREKLFSGRPSVGETVQIAGVRFTVIHQRRRILLDTLFHRGRHLEHALRQRDGLCARRAALRKGGYGAIPRRISQAPAFFGFG
jgi:putative ABC transport system permease protein